MSLCRQVKVLDVEREQKGKQLAELQARLSVEEQKDEERARELISLKQRLADNETSRSSLQKEVRSALNGNHVLVVHVGKNDEIHHIIFDLRLCVCSCLLYSGV